MKDYTLKILYSGSDGNATLLQSGNTAILIDAGRNARALTCALRAAAVDPASLSAVFLTHEHRDHTAALDVFLKQYPLPVHTVCACAMRLRCTASEALLSNLIEHSPCFEVSIGNITLSSFPTSHDSAGSVGYRITVTTKNGTHTVGYATDLGTVTPAVENGLLGCEAVVIEANHDEEMLKDGPYPYFLKQRIASRFGHLSNTDCAALCTKLAQNGTTRFVLAHLSETNNLPDLALSEVGAALAGYPVSLSAADPVTPTDL
jgi:phosphoribosyl 1,2-cyclic phosphodiesterase